MPFPSNTADCGGLRGGSFLGRARWLCLCAGLSACLCACVPGLSTLPRPDTERLLVAAPEKPPTWAFLGPICYRLIWRGADGGECSAIVAEGGSLEIEVARGRLQGIVAEPRGAAGGLAPAGALYPEALQRSDPYGLESEPRVLRLDWAGGWLSLVCSRLEEGGSPAESFNLDKLSGLVNREGVDPWNLSPALAAQRLAEGRFRSALLLSPRRFSTELPGPGPWAPESPFADAPLAAPGGAAWTAMLPAGVWRFAGREQRLAVSVNGDGSAVWIYLPADLP